MPIFEYLCKKCGNRFEKLQKGGADESNLCPVCGSEEVKKELSLFSSGSSSSTDKCYSGG